jgi:hypothetical protein
MWQKQPQSTTFEHMTNIDCRDAIAKLKQLENQLSKAKVDRATAMAINDAARFGKTRVKDAIRAVYNMKQARILDKDPKRGLTIKFADALTKTAKINAGHRPANFASFTGTRFTKKGLSVEVKKGSRKPIPSAFRLGVTKGIKGAASSGETAVAFARGTYGKPKFVFGKERKPINPPRSISTATAALNIKVQEKYGEAIQQQYQKRLIHHMQRMLSNI